MTSRRWAALAAGLATSATLAACGSNGDDKTTTTSAAAKTAGSGEQIVIGVAMAKSGLLQSYDEPSYNSFKLKVDQINHAGGIDGRKIKLVIGDTKSVIERTPSVAQNLISQGAQIMVVSCDFDFGSPAALVAQKAGMLSVSLCASSPKFGAQAIGDKAFSMQPSIGVEGATMAKFALTKGYKSAYLVLDDTLAYTRGQCSAFKKFFEQDGGKIVGNTTFKNGDQSYATLLNSLKGSSAAVAVLCSYPPGGASFLRQMRAGGDTKPVVSGVAFDGTEWLKSVPKLGTFYALVDASIFGDDPRPAVNQWVKDYTAANGSAPTKSQSMIGYVVGQTIEAAVKATGGDTSGAKLAKAIEAFKDQDLAYGPTTLSATNHIPLTLPYAALSFAGGKPSFDSMVTPPSGLTVADGAA